MSVIKGPVGEGRPGKKGSFIGQVLDSTKDEGITGRGRLDMTGKGKIEGVNDGGFRDDGGIIIVKGSIDLVVAGEGVGRGEFGAREHFPDDVEVL